MKTYYRERSLTGLWNSRTFFLKVKTKNSPFPASEIRFSCWIKWQVLLLSLCRMCVCLSNLLLLPPCMLNLPTEELLSLLSTSLNVSTLHREVKPSLGCRRISYTYFNTSRIDAKICHARSACFSYARIINTTLISYVKRNVNHFELKNKCFDYIVG